MLYAYISKDWDDVCTPAELGEVFDTLIAAGTPFTIEAVPNDDELPFIPGDDDGRECLSAAERNASLCLY